MYMYESRGDECMFGVRLVREISSSPSSDKDKSNCHQYFFFIVLLYYTLEVLKFHFFCRKVPALPWRRRTFETLTWFGTNVSRGFIFLIYL